MGRPVNLVKDSKPQEPDIWFFLDRLLQCEVLLYLRSSLLNILDHSKAHVVRMQYVTIALWRMMVLGFWIPIIISRLENGENGRYVSYRDISWQLHLLTSVCGAFSQPVLVCPPHLAEPSTFSAPPTWRATSSASKSEQTSADLMDRVYLLERAPSADKATILGTALSS